MSRLVELTPMEVAERDRIENDDTRDGILFRFWIKMASPPPVGRPSALMRALTRCVTVGQYRTALVELAREEGVNLP